MITCPNPSCKTANPEEKDLCQVCQSALPHYYLWGVGELVPTLRPGSVLNQRYLYKGNHIFLDTKPGVLPESPPDLPEFLLPYLHLSAYPLHVPRPYSVMRTPDGDYVLMLEHSALSIAQLGQGETATAGSAAPAIESSHAPLLLPMLGKVWAEAPPLRQLSWLWQIAQLWDAFAAEGVAATLTDDSLLRVDGSIVRLLALRQDAGARVTQGAEGSLPPSLIELVRSWLPLVETAHLSVKSFLDRLCEGAERQQLNAEQLAERLSQAMTICAQGQAVSYDLAVYTDQGPTRKRNEDACYPSGGTSVSFTSEAAKNKPQLVIVCDGIGGHQGGDVASRLAIQTIRARLEPFLGAEQVLLSATELSLAIEAAICAANDEISAQNDRAQRQARDRMGTTLVLALIRGAEVYIAHLGDSRAYRVSQRNCQQVTLDDDVASRQVRLGGSLYREVLTQPGSGSLIQALGMGSSQMLRPTVQRFVMDESCVFLLCSDGLSDSDRVEQFWQRFLLPLATGGRSTASVGQHLIELANKYNGHDNVTVGLLSVQVVKDSEHIIPRDLASPLAPAVGAEAAEAADASENLRVSRSRRGQTQLVSVPESPSMSGPSSVAAPLAPDGEPLPTAGPGSSSSQRMGRFSQRPSVSLLKRGCLALLLLAALGGISYLLFPGLSWQLRVGDEGNEPTATGQVSGAGASLNGSPGQPTPALANLTVKSYARIRQSSLPLPGSGDASNTDSSKIDRQKALLKLYPTPAASASASAIPGTLPAGSIVQVLSKQTSEDQSKWVQIKLCSIPSGATLQEVPRESDGPPDRPPDAPPAPGDSTGGNVEPFNRSETTQTGQPLMLSPGAQGWIVEIDLAAVSETIKDLDPQQQGTCGS